MRVGGKLLGAVLVALVLLVAFYAVQHAQTLERQREQNVEQLMSLPQYAGCHLEENGALLCPQSEDSFVLPDLTGGLLVLLGLILGAYLIRSDRTNRTILEEVKGTRSRLAVDERRALIESILTPGERKVVAAVREQPGITQATLRLRVDMSNAQLSVTLRELELRKIIRKVEDGRTNSIHLAREV